MLQLSNSASPGPTYAYWEHKIRNGLHTDPAFWSEVATLPAKEQEQALLAVATSYSGIANLPTEVKAAAFKAGTILPGATEQGQGTGMAKEDIALALQGNKIREAQKLQGMVSGNKADYTRDAITQGDETTPEYVKLDTVDGPQFVTLDKAINQTRTDTTGVDAQKAALAGYADIYSQGGLTAIDRARMEQARQIRATQARGRELAVMQDYAEQGRGGGNASMLARLQARQGATNAIAQDDLVTAGMALERRDAALAGMGNVGGSVQSSQDAIDRFNTEGERGRALVNLNAQNQGISMGWEENRGRERYNVDTQNQGLNQTFKTNAVIHAGNTDDARGKEAFNKGPMGGARGMLRDNIEATNPLLNAYDSGSEQLYTTGKAEADASAARGAGMAGAVGGVLGTVVGGVYGGPAGATAGGAAGSALGSSGYKVLQY